MLGAAEAEATVAEAPHLAAAHVIDGAVQMLDHMEARVCVNDMALPFGGEFDIDRTWDSPHQWHDRGKAVDINTTGSNQCPSQALGGIPNELALAFRQKCIDWGADPARSVVRSTHVHCNWPDPFTPTGG